MSVQLGFEDVGKDPTHWHVYQVLTHESGPINLSPWPSYEDAVAQLDYSIHLLRYQEGISPTEYSEGQGHADYKGQTDDPDFILEFVGVRKCDRWDCRPKEVGREVS